MVTKPSLLLARGEQTGELSFRTFIISAILTIILAISNAYLALKLGILVSASIPAAILSLGILRFFKNSTLLENNAIQTAASAGEAVAGGIAYTIPALIIIGYWTNFDYLTNFFIAATGGILGVLFSIPLRRILVNEPRLPFPEGRAIAMVLKSSIEKAGIRDILFGGIFASILELLQTGFKCIASSWSGWHVFHRGLFGIGVGFSSAMIGAGYLVGAEMTFSIFLGALISRLMVFPIVSQFYPTIIAQFSAEEAAAILWDQQMRYLGIGAMLFAGIWTFLNLIKPLSKNIYLSFNTFLRAQPMSITTPHADRDIPLPWIMTGVLLIAAILFLLFQFIMPIDMAGIDSDFLFTPSLIFGMVIYILILGFLFSVITSYFSAMVGVTASPGSSVIIAGILLTAWLLFKLIHHFIPSPLHPNQLKALEAMTIIIGSVITGIAAIANDNTQDLKVGQLVGATPWKQQVMLMWGVLISALVIPAVMQLLFNVYGIAGIMPPGRVYTGHASLPAPPAALMAGVTEAVFHHTLPWTMFGVGAILILLIIGINVLFRQRSLFRLSILGIAIGMYLPLASSFPLFLGGIIAKIIDGRLNKTIAAEEIRQQHKQRGTLIACGLVAGAALVDVALAIPFSLLGSPDALAIVGDAWRPYGIGLGFLSVFLLALWIYWRVKRK